MRVLRDRAKSRTVSQQVGVPNDRVNQATAARTPGAIWAASTGMLEIFGERVGDAYS